MNQKLQYNLNNPSIPLGLNLSVNEAVWISENYDSLKPHFESGMLKQVHDWFNSAEKALESTWDAVYQRLGEIYDKTINEENQLNETLKERVGEKGISSCIKYTIMNLKSYINQNPNDTGAQKILNQYYAIVNTRALIGEWEVRLLDSFLERGNPSS